MDLSFITLPASVVILIVTFSWIFFLLCSLRYKPFSERRKVNRNENLMFSVIIPAHNEEKVILDIVNDFLNQTYSNLEAIVTCHNCNDNTFDLVNQIRDKRLITLRLNTQRSGKALALNEALKHAKGDVIVQMDADNRVDENFLSKAVNYFSDPSLDALQVKVSTKNANFNLLTKCQQLEYDMFGIAYWEGRNAVGQSCTMGGTGVMFRRSVLESVGGWDNELIEDYDLYCKMVEKGIKIMYASDIECFDEKPPYWSDVIRQRARWIRGHFEIARKRILTQFSIFDFIYMISPLFYIAWYSCSSLVILYLLSGYLGINVSYWYVPSQVWVASLILMYSMFAHRLIKRKMPRDVLYLPIYFLFSFHWLIAFLMSLKVKSWGETKTEHGYVTG